LLRIAHRGASAHAPENTLEAFHLGFKMSAQGAEFDVHLCKSGEPVVIHDKSLKRTHGLDVRVADLTLKELQKHNVPSLAEVIESFAKDYTLFIELKDKAAVIPTGKLILQFAKKGYPPKHMRVISFKFSWLVELRAFSKDIVIGASPNDKYATTPLFIAKTKKAGMQSINPTHKYLNASTVKAAHKAGLSVFTWTVNSKDAIARMKKIGVDGIMGDYPERL
jgi:glycerophosphoryl diester phosphodiesterase